MLAWILLIAAIIIVVALRTAYQRSQQVEHLEYFIAGACASCSTSAAQLDSTSFRTVRRITEQDRESFRQVWQSISGHFESDPRIVIVYADLMVSELIHETPRSASDSYYGPEVTLRSRLWDKYRHAHEIAANAKSGLAKTEELHRAMILYTALFDELLAKRKIAAHVSSR